MDSIKLPFTDEQVKEFNEFQNLGIVHPLTCPDKNNVCRSSPTGGVLIANNEILYCATCDYTQDWTPNVLSKEMKEHIEHLRTLGFVF